MERRRLARSRGPHAEDEPVGPAGDRPQLRLVPLRHPEALEAERRVGREHPEDHVLVAAGRRDRRHPQLHLPIPDLDADLPVLRLAPLRDVELGHDLEPGDEGGPDGGGHAFVLEAVAVDTEADQRLLLRPPGFDVDVGHSLAPGVEDHPVDEANDRAVVGLHLEVRRVHGGDRVVGAEVAQDGGDAGPRLRLDQPRDELQDVPRQPDGEPDLVAGQQHPDTVDLPQVARIVDEDQHAGGVAPQRHPGVLAQEVELQVLHELGIDARAGLELYEGDLEEVGEGGAEVGLPHPILLHQDRLDVAAADPRLAHGGGDLVLRDTALRDEIVEPAEPGEPLRGRVFVRGDRGTRLPARGVGRHLRGRRALGRLAVRLDRARRARRIRGRARRDLVGRQFQIRLPPAHRHESPSHRHALPWPTGRPSNRKRNASQSGSTCQL